jgi:hypothetical protein
MSAKITELSRVRQHDSGLWIVEILSTVTKTWIVQGEHKTKKAADEDQKNWL